MTRAYSEVFLDDAMDTLGSAVEYAVLQCGMDGQEFLDLFVTSGIAEEFGQGNPLFVSGKSGIELAKEGFRRAGEQDFTAVELPYTDYPPEYWVGWILAFYQWYSGLSFEKIFKVLKYETVRHLYHPLHEADPRKAAEVFDMMLSKS